jgi:hypothetical protein
MGMMCVTIFSQQEKSDSLTVIGATHLRAAKGSGALRFHPIPMPDSFAEQKTYLHPMAGGKNMKAGSKRKLSSREWNAIYREIAAECVVKVVHVVLYIMLKRGWHKDRIRRYFDDVRALYKMGTIFGKTLTDADVIAYVDKYSGISPEEWADLESSVQVIVTDEA